MLAPITTVAWVLLAQPVPEGWQRCTAPGLSAALPKPFARAEAPHSSALGDARRLRCTWSSTSDRVTLSVVVDEYSRAFAPSESPRVLDVTTQGLLDFYHLTLAPKHSDVVVVGSSRIDTREFKGTRMERELRAYTGTQTREALPTDVAAHDEVVRQEAGAFPARVFDGRSADGYRVTGKVVHVVGRVVTLVAVQPNAFPREDLTRSFFDSFSVTGAPNGSGGTALKQVPGLPRLSLPASLRVGVWPTTPPGEFGRESELMASRLEQALTASGASVVRTPAVPPDFEAEVFFSVPPDVRRPLPKAYVSEGTVVLTSHGRPVERLRSFKAIAENDLDLNLYELTDALARKVAEAVVRAEPTKPQVAKAQETSASSYLPLDEPPRPAARAAPTSAPTREAPSPSRDVVAAPQPTAWALVIGVEKYRDVAPAEGARRDAEAVASLLQRTLGVPASHVKVALDERASRADLEKHLDWLKTAVPAGARVYFYYAGHGAPDPESGASFLLPYDADADALNRTTVSLPKVLEALGQTKAREVVALVDACFSGSGSRSVMARGVRPLVPLKELKAPSAVTLFTAASGAEISNSAGPGQGGLFTKTVVEALSTGRADHDGDGQVSLQELLDDVGPRVTREAAKQSHTQRPSLRLGAGLTRAQDLVVAWGYPAQ